MGRRQCVVRIIVLFLLCFLSLKVFSKSTVVPIVYKGDEVYVAGELDFYKNVNDAAMAGSAKVVSQSFWSSAKKSDFGESLTYFSDKDGSRKKMVGGDSPLKLQTYQRITDISYLNAILWGEQVILPVKYSLGKREFVFREDFYCQLNNCKRSLKSLNQPFEVTYRYLFENDFLSTIKQDITKSMVENGKGHIFLMNDVNDSLDIKKSITTKQNNKSFKFAIFLSELVGEKCVDCEVDVYESKAEEQKFSNIRQFALGINDLLPSYEDDDSIKKHIVKYSKEINIDKGMPTVNWDNDKPSLTHVNYLGYMSEWRGYLSGEIEGYMLDGDYAYVVVSKVVGTSNVKAGKRKQFQIFVTKAESDGDYYLSPNTSDSLDSRALVFDSDFLLGLDQIINHKK